MAQIITNTTQNFLDIEDVSDNLVVLKDGSCCMVLETNAINFGLLSEDEQDATIYAYAALLNSLTFSIQILIRSDVKDISNYLKLLEQQEVKQSNAAKKQQITGYKNFIASLITERNVLEKKFFLCVPFSYLELGLSKSIAGSFSNKKQSLPYDKSYILEKAKVSLDPKRDHLMRQLGRIGLAAKQLSTQELIQLLFSMYNSSSTQGQRITNTKDYTVPLVQPAYIRPKEATMSDNTQVPNQTPPPTGGPTSGPTPVNPPTGGPVVPGGNPTPPPTGGPANGPSTVNPPTGGPVAPTPPTGNQTPPPTGGPTSGPSSPTPSNPTPTGGPTTNQTPKTPTSDPQVAESQDAINQAASTISQPTTANPPTGGPASSPADSPTPPKDASA